MYLKKEKRRWGLQLKKNVENARIVKYVAILIAVKQMNIIICTDRTMWIESYIVNTVHNYYTFN